MKRKRIFLSLALLASASLCMAAHPASWTRESGTFVRLSAGYPTQLAVGIDRHITPHISVGGEVTTFNEMCGMGADIDVRTYLMRSAVSPFVDAKFGYGLIGKTIDMKNCYSDFYAGMLGVSWKRLDVAGGFWWDQWNKYTPALSVCWNFRLGR